MGGGDGPGVDELSLALCGRPPGGSEDHRQPAGSAAWAALHVYLDSCALLKDFLPEEGSEAIRELLLQTALVATSRISYVECRAALARARRESRLSTAGERTAISALDQRWVEIAIVEVDEALTREAGRLTGRYQVRAADAIHLASALVIASTAEEPLGSPAGTVISGRPRPPLSSGRCPQGIPEKVARGRIELPTPRFSAACSAN